MKCHTCGTENTRVLGTRAELDGLLIRRRHECGNEHRFNTFQLHESAARSVGLRQLRSSVETLGRGVARRTDAWKRKVRARRLLSQGMSSLQVAQQLGISDARVRQIRSDQ
jgi:transcriptional regulator NrdR family protein